MFLDLSFVTAEYLLAIFNSSIYIIYLIYKFIFYSGAIYSSGSVTTTIMQHYLKMSLLYRAAVNVQQSPLMSAAPTLFAIQSRVRIFLFEPSKI